MNYREIEGNLITLAQAGEFDVIGHGVNCQCVMGSGIAPQMAKAFGCDTYPLEDAKYRGNMNKLGQIQFKNDGPLFVVNCYTQFTTGGGLQLDYEALTLCMRKINYRFGKMKVGLPQVGCGLAGGSWERVKQIIQTELFDCDVTVVIFKK